LSSRQEFRVVVQPDDQWTFLSVQGVASVATSGALGISKMRNELARLSSLIMVGFEACPDPQGMASGDLGRFAAAFTAPEPGRGGEYALVIIVVVVIAVVAGLVAAWAVLGR
jgi:hypothetical protein